MWKIAEMQTTPLTYEQVFGQEVLTWGKKHPGRPTLLSIWRSDPDYLIWGANLKKGSPCPSPLPSKHRALVTIAGLIFKKQFDDAARMFEEFQRWSELTEDGRGLETLPRPTSDECREAFEALTILGGHSDLDGIMSMALIVHQTPSLRSRYSDQELMRRIRVLRYGFRELKDYSAALDLPTSPLDGGEPPTTLESVVIVDFAAHPAAALTLDHHVTCLSYWELGSAPPRGIFDPSIPSCPRLLSIYTGLKAPEEILQSCDMIDGARYSSLDQALELDNPFISLECCLSIDVTEIELRKLVLELASNDLDVQHTLKAPIWKARLALASIEFDAQREYWAQPGKTEKRSELLFIADSREAPHSASRFRFVPFSAPGAVDSPYMLTLRASGPGRVNLGIGQNPFFHDQRWFESKGCNVGALSRRVGNGGGGRKEVGSTTIPLEQLAEAIRLIDQALCEAAA